MHMHEQSEISYNKCTSYENRKYNKCTTCSVSFGITHGVPNPLHDFWAESKKNMFETNEFHVTQSNPEFRPTYVEWVRIILFYFETAGDKSIRLINKRVYVK